jgi:hypothetical protein
MDEGVFGTYITGFLGEETLEDKTEALEGILSEVMNNILICCHEILDKSKKVSQIAGILTGNNASSGEDMDVKLVRLLKSQPRPTTVQRIYKEEERRICEAILAQHAEMSDQEDDNDSDHPNDSKENVLIKDTNAALFQQAERKREKAKSESQKKKDKDKDDREKQKQLQEERKEKFKTQKGER